jgi:hypothetical protein
VLVEKDSSKIFEEEHTQAVGNRISPMPLAFSDPVRLGGLCQAMFIGGARCWVIPGRRSSPKKSRSKSCNLIADGLRLLLQNQDDADPRV